MTKRGLEKKTKVKEPVEVSEEPQIDVWTYVNSISKNKKYVPITEETQKAYDPYTINKALSLYPESLPYANEMNEFYFLPKNLQYDYLINSVRSNSRYAKWVKKDKDSTYNKDIAMIREYYNYSESKARSAISILTKQQLAIIKQKLEKGGVAK